METNRADRTSATDHVEDRRVMTVEEVGEILRIGRNTMYGLIRDEAIGSIKVGRRRLITREHLNDFLASRTPQNI